MLSRRDLITRFMAGMGLMASARFAQASTPAAAQPLILRNTKLEARWVLESGALKPLSLMSIADQVEIPLPAAFALEMRDGQRLDVSGFRIDGLVVIQPDRLQLQLVNDKGLRLLWQASLPKDAHYLRQSITLNANREQAIARVIMMDVAQNDAKASGTLRGCPLVSETVFYGFEHPLSEMAKRGERTELFLPRSLPLKKGQSVRYGSVIGLCEKGQMRRAFAAYLEAERPRKTAPFLHYNSWYDIGFSDIRFDEEKAMDAVETVTQKLTTERNVRLASFLMDDGWDNPETLWDFHDGFPKGFRLVSQKAMAMGSAIGVWMSPWGGYGNEKAARLQYGAVQGFETNKDGFALSGRKYFARFRDACLRMIREYGVNQFKIDGMGDMNQATADSQFDSDFDAAIALIEQLRAEKPELYINLTYGTFASPFWLFYADSIWRGGKDHDHTGQGTKRQQWITYRDGDTYSNVVKKSDLFPLHSLMLHGIIFAQHTPNLKSDPFGDFASEVRSFFASGTQLQELYITPSLLNDRHWDQLAEGAKFAQSHASLLQDSHWVGGNPMAGDVYGWAAWRDNKGLLTLRNPSDKEQRFSFDLQNAWELPESAAQSYEVKPVWESEAAAENWEAGKEVTVTLAPFAVKSWLAQPV